LSSKACLPSRGGGVGGAPPPRLAVANLPHFLPQCNPACTFSPTIPPQGRPATAIPITTPLSRVAALAVRGHEDARVHAGARLGISLAACGHRRGGPAGAAGRPGSRYDRLPCRSTPIRGRAGDRAWLRRS